jgi:ribosome maturation factor RimP
LEQTLFDALLDRATAECLELVDVEVTGAKSHPVVTVFLDCDGGVGLDVLTSANSWISDEIEQTGCLSSSYTLNVSSPGGRKPRPRPAE